MAAVKELLETLAGGGSTSKRVRLVPMHHRCFMFTTGFVALLRLPDKRSSEIYIVDPYSEINPRRAAILIERYDTGLEFTGG